MGFRPLLLLQVQVGLLIDHRLRRRHTILRVITNLVDGPQRGEGRATFGRHHTVLVNANARRY